MIDTPKDESMEGWFAPTHTSVTKLVGCLRGPRRGWSAPPEGLKEATSP